MEGVIRAKRKAEMSDLRILVVDISVPINEGLSSVQEYCVSEDESITTVLVLNKIDLYPVDDSLLTQYADLTGISKQHIFPVSCHTKEGLEKFSIGMTTILQNKTGSNENILATNERQRNLLAECISYLHRFSGSPTLDESDLDDPRRDIVKGAEELKYAANALGKISGRVDPEDILGIISFTVNNLITDIIFADFCIGK